MWLRSRLNDCVCHANRRKGPLQTKEQAAELLRQKMPRYYQQLDMVSDSIT